MNLPAGRVAISWASRGGPGYGLGDVVTGFVHGVALGPGGVLVLLAMLAGVVVITVTERDGVLAHHLTHDARVTVLVDSPQPVRVRTERNRCLTVLPGAVPRPARAGAVGPDRVRRARPEDDRPGLSSGDGSVGAPPGWASPCVSSSAPAGS